MSSLEVFILTYNRASYLRESIASVLASSFTEFTLTVVDNCSTDNTREVVESFDDPRLKYVCHPENIGGINNINSGIHMSHGDYIVLFHDDDLMKPLMLEKEYEFLESHPDAGCVSCLTSDFYDDGRVIDSEATYQGEYKIYKGRELFDAYFGAGTNTCCPSIMYRGQMLRSHDLIFDPEVGPCCDIKLLFDIEKLGYGVASLNECLMMTRRHAGQDSTMNYVPMHIELYGYLHNDPYYGGMLSEKREWGKAKYHDFSKALASMEIKGIKDSKILREYEKVLRDSCGCRFTDRLKYLIVVTLTRMFPGLSLKVYKKHKG